jgi:hypothetical protein
MAESSIDNPFAVNPQWWGQRVLPTVAPDPIPVGGSLNFVFPSPPCEWAGTQTNWICTIHVVEHRGGPDIITPRVIASNAQQGLYTGILTADETSSLESGKFYFLVAIFTAFDKEIDMFVRFKVRTPWVVNP